MELFVWHVAQTGVEVQEHVLGATDRIAVLEPALRQTPPDLERREQGRGLGGPHPFVLLELGVKSAREALQSLTPEQAARENMGWTTSRTRAQQQREQLDVVERLGSEGTQPLARPTARIGSLHDRLPGTIGGGEREREALGASRR